MSTFIRLLGFLRPHRRGFFASLGLGLLFVLATVAIPPLTGRAIDALDHHDGHALVLWSIGVGAAGLARLAINVSRRLVAGRVSLGVEYDLRNLLYAHLQRLELGFFDHQQTGQLMSRSTVDLQGVRFFLGYGLVLFTQPVFTITLAGIFMFALDPLLAALSLAPTPFVIAIAWRYGRRSRPALQEVQQRIAELTADAEESVSGVRVIKAFAREERMLERYRHGVGRVFDQSLFSTRLAAFYNPLIAFVPNLGLAVVLFVGGRQVVHGELTIGQFAAFYTYLLLLISPMRSIGAMLNLAQRATAGGARIFQILDREPTIAAPADPTPLPPGGGAVELRDVELRFEGASRPALSHIDLTVPAGRTIALVGASGSGKTALVSLLPRLYDVTAGSVLIDGIDVREVSPTSLRGEIAVVSDDPFLFSASVRENIAYGRPEATAAEVEQAARRAQAHDFIAALPDGYDTLVGERGLTLSGGQRQRLAIARALVTEPRILVLDDATSSVDASTEQKIKQALRDIAGERTTFVIAHRLSTIALADEIVVLEDGAIAAQGRHEELLGTSELYREIVEKGLPDQVFLTRKAREPEEALGL